MLNISNARKSFGDIKILDGVNLLTENHGILGLAGPSGGGKTTLLRCIQRLETLDSGFIEYEGKSGFMFQDFQLFPHMTVLQNLLYAPSLKSKSKDLERRAGAMLGALGLESKKNEYPSALSGGQKQRAALARTLMTDPDFLLCDEPTSGLDVATTDDVVQLLKSINRPETCKDSLRCLRTGVTMVIASHDLDFLTKISDRIVLLKNGKIEADINPTDFDDPIGCLKGHYL
ncbi:MAG: ATP-binding cassette domain-containing protein [Holosporaceae bacterium]|jgi:polar amino acid transport system ATP-binding protein|nr:ATP-binding cassette domain-containing protein [Holosporaceae bacterium]